MPGLRVDRKSLLEISHKHFTRLGCVPQTPNVLGENSRKPVLCLYVSQAVSKAIDTIGLLLEKSSVRFFSTGIFFKFLFRPILMRFPILRSPDRCYSGTFSAFTVLDPGNTRDSEECCARAGKNKTIQKRIYTYIYIYFIR